MRLRIIKLDQHPVLQALNAKLYYSVIPLYYTAGRSLGVQGVIIRPALLVEVRVFCESVRIFQALGMASFSSSLDKLSVTPEALFSY